MPALGVTVDGVPGRINRATVIGSNVGVAYGHCREICGVGHHIIPIVVEIISQEKYHDFLKLGQVPMAGSLPIASGLLDRDSHYSARVVKSNGVIWLQFTPVGDTEGGTVWQEVPAR